MDVSENDGDADVYCRDAGDFCFLGESLMSRDAFSTLGMYYDQWIAAGYLVQWG